MPDHLKERSIATNSDFSTGKVASSPFPGLMEGMGFGLGLGQSASKLGGRPSRSH